MTTVFMRAWLLCGTLDALYATAITWVRGGSAAATWRGVASGPFGAAAASWGLAGTLLGLAVHFALMAAMVAAGLWLAARTALGEIAPWKAGTVYGLAIYAVMYGLVLPARFGMPFPDPDRLKVLLALIAHVFLVGIPLFVLFRRRPLPS